MQITENVMTHKFAEVKIVDPIRIFNISTLSLL